MPCVPSPKLTWACAQLVGELEPEELLGAWLQLPSYTVVTCVSWEAEPFVMLGRSADVTVVIETVPVCACAGDKAVAMAVLHLSQVSGAMALRPPELQNN